MPAPRILPRVGQGASSAGGVTLSGTPGPATLGVPYSFTPSVSGGSGTNVFAAGGALPAGLSIATATGTISGTPASAGTSSLAIVVTNAGGYAVLPLTIVVGAAANPGTLDFSDSSNSGLIVALAA